MSDEAAFVPGRFVWADLMTTDVEVSKKFYFELFPTWKSDPVDMGPAGIYHRFSLEGRHAGGMMALDKSHCLESHWVPYATVASVDEATAKVAALGGKVLVPPTDIPNVGRFSMIADGQGAALSPMSLREEPPEQSGPLPEGTFCWHELITTDPAAATTFYTSLFGWSHAEVPTGRGPYHLFRRGERDAAGMLPMPPDATGQPAWTVFVYTSDIEASVAKVRELGGKVFKEPQAMPGVGQLAIVADPLGAMFAVFKSERA